MSPSCPIEGRMWPTSHREFAAGVQDRRRLDLRIIPACPEEPTSVTSLPARRTVLKAGAAAAAVLLAGCTSQPKRPTASSTAAATPTASPEDTTFTMGIAATPVTLDPALALDTESYRVTRQMLETLIGVDPATGVPA